VSAVYGVVCRDGADVGRGWLGVMAGALGDFGRDGFGEWAEGGAGLGQARGFTTAEGRLEAMPAVDRLEGFAFTAAARLDNRDELIRELGICGNDAARSSDSHLVLAAYRRFGEGPPGTCWVTGVWPRGIPVIAGCSWPAISSGTRPCTTTPAPGSLPSLLPSRHCWPWAVCRKSSMSSTWRST
jgi:hypothetical protein